MKPTTKISLHEMASFKKNKRTFCSLFYLSLKINKPSLPTNIVSNPEESMSTLGGAIENLV